MLYSSATEPKNTEKHPATGDKQGQIKGNVRVVYMVKKRSGIPLSVTHPDIASDWHPEKNGDVTPDQVTFGSNKRFWWICPEGPDHEWQAQPNSRIYYSQGCPCCSGNKVSVTNSLATLFPEVAAQWHPEKNRSVTPELVTARSDRRFWWICQEGPDHEWQARPHARTSEKPTGCPCCSGKKVSVTNSLSPLFPEVAAQWHPEKNGNVTPDQIVWGSNKRFWWTCPEGPDHEWQASPNDRIRYETWCPYCSGKKVSVTNSLSTLFPEVAAQWHPEKNDGVTPDRVVAGSVKKSWWLCPEAPDHEWPAEVNRRTRNAAGCPCCRGIKVSVTNSLSTLFAEVAAQLHPDKNNGVSPDDVAAGTHTKYWWICPEGPDHEWQAQANSRTYLSDGCPCCAGKKVSVTNSLSILFPEVAAQWHPEKNNGVTPDQLTVGSSKLFWWVCPYSPDHEWPATIVDRTAKNSGCPYCKLVPRSKQEIELAFELLLFIHYDIDDHKETINGQIYDCDIIIREHRLIVEFDAAYWHLERVRRDRNKTDNLQKAGWNVIRVREHPLPPISPMDVSVPLNVNMKPAADAVLLKIKETLDIPLDGLDDYLKATEAKNSKVSSAFIRKLLKAKSEPIISTNI